jgi:hypothetical protein
MEKEYHETRGAQGNSQGIFRKIFAKVVDETRAAWYSGGRCKSLTIKHLRGAPA